LSVLVWKVTAGSVGLMHAPGNLNDSHKVALIIFMDPVHDGRLLDPERGGVHGLRLGHVLGDVPLEHGGLVLGDVVLWLWGPGGNGAGGLGLLLEGLLLWGPVHQLNLTNQRIHIYQEKTKFREKASPTTAVIPKVVPKRALPDKVPKWTAAT
jgi:hypothetical protein